MHIIKQIINVLMLMLWLGVSQLVQAGEKVVYLHTDALGSAVAASDENRVRLWRESYQPYGSRIQNADDGKNKQWYTGKIVDEDTGLSYYGARYYDPAVGRFMGIDPVGFDESNPVSFNRYAYANNNPYKFVDPDGETPVDSLVVLIPTFGRALGGLVAYTQGVITGDAVLARAANAGLEAQRGENLFLLGEAATLFFLPPGSSASGSGAIATNTTSAVAKKLSKVKKGVQRDIPIKGGKFTKTTKVFPGRGPGQSRSVMEFVKNSEGKVIRSRKFSFDRGNKFQGKKRARGGPEGRGANENN